MICFTTYEDHDVDNDPVIVLPCHHFFAASTLDGHLQIKLVYEMSGASFTGLKSLVGSSLTGNGKQQQCPECRAIIHSVRRYGRVLRLMELRSLERKHVMMAESALAQQATLVTEQTASQDVLTSLQRLEHFIRKSPMTKVFEACDGVMDIAVPPPPPGPLIRCLELQGIAYAGISASYEDVNYVKAKAFFEQGILLADDTLSNRSGAQLRLALSYLVSKHCRNADLAKDMVIPLVDWILDHPVRFEDLISRAQDLKSKVLEMGPLMHEELKEIVIAMSSSGGYNYGGAASSHWYECPNGHPFFIGECGGAVQTSMCHECGAEIGGRNHSLLQTNRRVTGALLDALS